MAIFKPILRDMDAFLERDPAARSRLEVALLYPGFHALVMHRLAHGLWRRRLKVAARVLSALARFLTQIEIHPAARLGKSLVIDHGGGLVIGETTEIGDGVTLYQGVTLGGLAPAINSKAQALRKRHPTLEDGVIVGAGAQVLGPVRVGFGARIGANAVVLDDVEARSTVAGVPARVFRRGHRRRFAPYGVGVDNDSHDPAELRLRALEDRLRRLEKPPQTRKRKD